MLSLTTDTVTADLGLSPWRLGGSGYPCPAPQPPCAREIHDMPDGKICYLEIPATDVKASADFYTKVFGWRVRERGDGALAFDDTAGAVSGTWVRGRAPARDPGMVVYVMVDAIDVTLKKVAGAGGKTVTPRTAIGSGSEAFAMLADPAGNVIGIYQDGKG
jgi:predicted enzyme related to lactoylglutathione lyase